ncbi:murein biosynthesis integral membrane protein MurJ [Yunchengibacter salinarum]|uniref:murein biosynthesis integral membrane protein MurJ n=1 Tax=Yunchengibacter salinarum TaxID=3133399 RepID=UPI0035B6A0B8
MTAKPDNPSPRKAALAGFRRHAGTVGGLTMLSRLFGFARDVLMAAALGAGPVADAFFIAFKLPNFFRRITAEGAFNASFVPLYAGLLGTTADEAARERAADFAGKVLGWFLPVLLILLAIMEAAMVPVMTGLTGGFDGDTEKFDLAVELGRATFPYLVTISLVAFFSGLLNAHTHFAAAAFVPVLFNLVLITALLSAGETALDTARALAWAVSLSGLVQLVWVYGAARRAGIRIRFQLPRPSADVARLARLMGPAALGAGALQLGLLVDLFLAARFLDDGAVSWLFYADRLHQLPIGVVGVAVGIVLLPGISRLLADGDRAGANRQQNDAILFAMTLTLPAAAALAAIPEALISGLFERGAFTRADSVATGRALMAYALGLPAFVLVKVLTPGYHARRDTRTPVRYAMMALVVNLALNLILIGPMAHAGLALATSLSAWVNVALLARGLTGQGLLEVAGDTWRRLGRALVATALMTAGLIGLASVMPALVAALPGGLTGGIAGDAVPLVLLVGAGLTLYFGAAFALGVYAPASLLARLSRRPR